MSTVSFSGLLIVSLIAVAAPILVASVKRVKRGAAKRRRGDRRRDYRRAVCSCLGEDRSAGQCGGPAWPLLGLAFLLFLAGLEIVLRATAPRQFRAPLAGFAGSLLLGAVAGVAFHAVGLVRDPFFLAITLAATSLRRVVPSLKVAGRT